MGKLEAGNSEPCYARQFFSVWTAKRPNSTRSCSSSVYW
ncbi:tetratricopeptide repeat family domain protein [Vibrio parahaemolyticus VPTS-2010]|nr:hypothetical protein D031_1885 [Vibrio parahaemolyticus VP-48]EXJ46575.1 tetratricopeptide repeat family domain protein [Vibrio parahaemolyticus VPTS-2010]